MHSLHENLLSWHLPGFLLYSGLKEYYVGFMHLLIVGLGFCILYQLEMQDL